MEPAFKIKRRQSRRIMVGDVPIGDGVPCDLRAACDLYRAAAAQGHREARRRLTALGENEHPYISVGALGDEVPSGEPRETE